MKNKLLLCLSIFLFSSCKVNPSLSEVSSSLTSSISSVISSSSEVSSSSEEVISSSLSSFISSSFEFSVHILKGNHKAARINGNLFVEQFLSE